MTEVKEINPRDYQQNIFETAKNKNTLVVLPTGMGKTMIALLLSKHRLEKFPKSKILFLAPTKPLAEQHLNYFKSYLSDLYADMTLFTGKVNAEKRKEIWQNVNIIFSTPQCIANDVKSNKFDLKEVSLLIEDECHKCLNNYDYTFVAENYLKNSENPKILGLTASPGSNTGIIKQICKNLGIEAVEIRHRYSEDVKPYIQELNTEIVKVDFPEQFKRIEKPLAELYERKVEELKNRKLLFTSMTTKTILLDLQKKLQREIYLGKKNFNILKGVSVCAQAIKISHAIELLETQSIATLSTYLKNLDEQARQEQSRAVEQIVKSVFFQEAYKQVLNLEEKGIEHPKIEKLKELVLADFKANPNTKIMIFAQFRDTIVKICKELNSLKEKADIKAKVFVGQAIKNDTGLNQKEQQAVLNEFKLGITNVLCATSIGEEGLDIPEVNCVVFYEPIPSAIRQIQRKGRTARLMPGKLVILMTSKTLDETYYWAAFQREKKMYGILDNIQKDFNKKNEEQKTL